MKTLTQLTLAGALGVALLANSVSAQAPPDGKRPGNRPDGPPPGGGQQGGQRGGPGGGPGGPGGIDQILRDLNLTDAQQGKVEAISRVQQEKMKALNDDFMAQLKGILNEEQFKKVSEAQQRPGGRQGGQGGFGGPGGPGGGGPGGQRGGFNPLEQIAKELNLSAEQQTKFDAARQAQQEKMRGLFQKMQSGDLDREGMMAEGAKLREEMLKDWKGILNAEQYAKVEEAMKRGPQGGGPPGGQRPEGKKRPE